MSDENVAATSQDDEPEIDFDNLVKPGASIKIKRAALYKLVDYVLENPEERVMKIMNMLDKVLPSDLLVSQRNLVKNAINDKTNWYQLLIKIAHLNPDVIPDMVKAFLVDSILLTWEQQEENRRRQQCNIPWTILLDPTSACNLRCTGCWAGEYGKALNLTYDEIDSIVRQGKELGVHFFLYTGGEPLMRKHDLIKIAENHPDCSFLAFTNATLIDEDFVQDLIRVKNFVPAISVEGIAEATDVRRGKGTFARIEHAMTLLRDNGLPFGVSVCHTSQNSDAIVSEEFIDWLVDQGALFAWFFTFMPVGVGSPKELMATPEQRADLYYFIRKMRNEKPIFTLDFQNDGEYVGGCIAGGRRFLHINPAGDVEPCVFCHYSNCNIRDVSLLEALHSPLFMQYYNNQPFDGNNLLRPCPIYENTGKIAEMVEASGAKSTDLTHPEDPRDLTQKFAERAEAWEPVAEKIWNDPQDVRYRIRREFYIGQSESDIDRFNELGRMGDTTFEEREEDLARH